MIRIVLLGRTGNHLFQYALGRVLAEKHGVPLVMDGSWFNRQGWREVSHFLRLPSLRARILRDPTWSSRALLKLTNKHRWQFGKFPFLAENPVNHTFDPSFLDAPPDCALSGYFQSWKYFAHMECELRKEITNLLSPGGGSIDPDGRSVAVHVRRGDFLKHPAFQVCGIDYYRRAMDRMRSRVAGAEFLVFSDDPAWCRATFREPDTRVIDSGANAASPLHDLRLMTAAGHHIISNSSYSWWAAWLGRKSGQQVLAPSRWFAKDVVAPMEDKLLPGWEMVECT